MRNLVNTRHDRFKLDEGQKSTATAWDPTDDTLVFSTGPGPTSSRITIKALAHDTADLGKARVITSWEAPDPDPNLSHDRVLDLHTFPDTQTLSLILAGGDIIQIRQEPLPNEEPIEILGTVDAGILATSWSPDESLLALATGASSLLLMTRDFDTLATIPLSPEDVNVSDHVSVGWGKKETQFKGRGVAKALRDPTVPEHVDEGSLSAFDDGSERRVEISWRGDGEFFAVNSVLKDAAEELSKRRRIIRVFSREGELESVSEAVNGLEGALSWKPGGQLIAGVQRLEERIDVVFFERNGLRHGEFSLRLSKEEMATVGAQIDLKWNSDSTVLAVCMKDRVQLWTVGNYHYYLKQDIRLEATRDGAVQTIWHPERPLQLSVSSGTDLRRLSYDFKVCRGSVTVPHDLGLVAVVDGATLKVTPLRITNVPPPMAFDEVDLPDNALDVAISETGTELAVLQANRQVSLWQCDYASKPPKKASFKASADLSSEVEDAQPIRILEPSGLVTHGGRIYYTGAAEDDTTNDTDNEPRSRITKEGNWLSPFGMPINSEWQSGGNLLVTSDIHSLQIRNCTSYVVTPSHLIYTTSQHLLKFIHLHDGQLDVPADEPEKDERCRSIERGAKIVTVMPSAYSLVLQMPRGNLETIYPRALVLAGIRQSIRSRDYKKAFSICRTQRVDMNILHDYMPEQFMRDVDLIISQLKKTEYVDLLLSSLSEDDVSRTIYRETLSPKEETNATSNGIPNGGDSLVPTEKSKINKICNAFLQSLEKSPGTRLQNIVTAHVCKNPPDLEAGLRLVAELRRQKDETRLEQAVEHICFLADVNQLYETALGLYDLDVALLVAQQSQKDPKEYLPYLQNLHEMQSLRMRFSIDNDLKRHAKALTHLHSLEEFEELKTYMSKHDLYSTAIDLYRYDQARLAELMRLYADHLLSRNRFKEAGIAYEYISDHTSAYEAFRSVGLWRECLSNASAVPVSANELTSLASDLSANAEEGKQYSDAATIQLDYLSDLDAAIKLWCKAHNFSEAIRQASLQPSRREDLLRTVVDPGLIDSSANMTELLAEMKTQLAAQLPRLRELREKKEQDPMAFLDGAEGGAGDADIPDNLSLAPSDVTTSAGTFLTRYTNVSTGTLATNATRKTSKNRRREERKRARGKKGTVYEEEYLVNSVARLIERLDETREDVGRLVEGLMRRGMRERAVAVQGVFDEVLGAARGCMEEVFSPAGEGSAATMQNGGGYVGINGEIVSRPWGGQGVLYDALAAPQRKAPVLKEFERLGILG